MEAEVIRKFALMLCILFSLASVSGCGQKNTPPEKKEDPGLKGKLVFGTNRTDLVGTKIKALVEDFMKAYPGISIEIESYKDPNEALKIKAATAELPDVSIVPQSIDKTGLPNYYLPLDDLGFNEDNLFAYSTGLGEDGRLFMINAGINYDGIIYNKKAFRQAGITMVPSNKTELFEVCKKLKAAGIVPFAINFNDVWPLKWYGDEMLYSFEMTGNPNFKNELANKRLLNDEKGGILEGFKLLREMKDKGYLEPDLNTSNWGEFRADHAEGKVAMSFLGTWYLAQMEDSGAAKDDIGMFPFPGSSAVLQNGDWYFGISRNTNYPEAAKTFLKWLWQEGRYAEACNLIPPLKNSKVKDSSLSEFTSFGSKVINASPTDKAVPDYFIKSKISLNTALQEYLTSSNPEEVVKKYNERWEAAKK